jgi:hypothetical protein
MSLESGGSLTGGHNLCPGQKTPQSDQNPPPGGPDRGDVITHDDADQKQDQSEPHPFNVTNRTTKVTVNSTVANQTINDLTVNDGKCSISNHGDLPVSLKLNQSHAFYASCNPLPVEVNTNLAHLSAGWTK